MRLASCLLLFCVASSAKENLVARAEEAFSVGFAEIDITPALHPDKPVWIAGYGHNRRATGVHDPLMARAVVLKHGDAKIALVSVDLIGLQYPTVKQIRDQLPEFRYVMVSSTHNHEGPDTIGLWGQTPLTSGVDPEYLTLVVERVAEAILQAEKVAAAATVEYGAAEDESLLGDSRLPKVYDGVLRTLCFKRVSDGQRIGALVQWNCHPESMGSKNTLLTADFPYATVAALKERYECPVAYFTGAVGGLMAPPDGRVKNAAGKLLSEGDFEYARAYGEEVAALAGRALDSAEPIVLFPIEVSARPIAVPLENALYHAARSLGVLKREGRIWSGDFEDLGDPLAADDRNSEMAVETEVACLRLGELHIACIPGELYPELVYGQFQTPADPAADYAEADLEPPVAGTLPGKKWLLFGLANDEIGYIIPKRQWDQLPPFAYGRKSSQYGEINSCGPEIAPLLMQALENRIKELPRP